MEDPVGVSAPPRAGCLVTRAARAQAHRLRGLVLLVLLLGGIATPALGQEASPPDSTRGRPGLGPTGLLWGRLWVDEESPDGPWTPLAGVEVMVYPYAASLVSELERIRETARDSGRQYETAAARFQETLRAYARPLDPGHSAPTTPAPGIPGSGPGPEASGSAPVPDGRGAVRRRTSDPAGVFVFDELPAGEWLVVAVRIAPYGSTRTRLEEARPGRSREPRFAGGAVTPSAREAEIWLEQVRVRPGERVRLLWSDRGRWFVGPLR